MTKEMAAACVCGWDKEEILPSRTITLVEFNRYFPVIPL